MQVCQAWDASKFNFTKALQQEVLFQFEPGLPNSSLEFIPASPARTSPSLVFINVSPIEYGHILLVPQVLDQLTQLVDQASMRLALQFCEHTSNPYFRMCYNSLGAYGTINHLHFQVCSCCYTCCLVAFLHHVSLLASNISEGLSRDGYASLIDVLNKMASQLVACCDLSEEMPQISLSCIYLVASYDVTFCCHTHNVLHMQGYLLHPHPPWSLAARDAVRVRARLRKTGNIPEQQAEKLHYMPRHKQPSRKIAPKASVR